METEIEERSSGEIYVKLLEMLKYETQREEDKSKTLWQNQKSWYENFEKNYGKEEPIKNKKKQKQIQKKKTAKHPQRTK